MRVPGVIRESGFSSSDESREYQGQFEKGTVVSVRLETFVGRVGAHGEYQGKFEKPGGAAKVWHKCPGWMEWGL